MNIVVCIKQVAGRGAVTDPRTGLLQRGEDARLNPYDRYALEAALQLRCAVGGTVTALSMGPARAEQALRDAAAMGVDRLVLACDPAFAGADVYATAVTLAAAINYLGGFDLILCGRQATDGDTAQVGPSLAARLSLPFCPWVRSLVPDEAGALLAEQQLTGGVQSVRVRLPALITVTEDIGTPRLPSLRQSLTALKAPVERITASQLSPHGELVFGQAGSHTRVVRVFAPQGSSKAPPFACSPESAAKIIDELLSEVTV